MKNISLIKVSVMVFSAITASFIVNAKDAALADEAISEIAAEQNGQLVDQVAFSVLDTNNDGLLSQQEVDLSKNKFLIRSFKKIDVNGDESLSKQELANFVAKASKSIG